MCVQVWLRLAHVFYVFRLFYFYSSFFTVLDNLHAQERLGLAEISNFIGRPVGPKCLLIRDVAVAAAARADPPLEVLVLAAI